MTTFFRFMTKQPMPAGILLGLATLLLGACSQNPTIEPMVEAEPIEANVVIETPVAPQVVAEPTPTPACNSALAESLVPGHPDEYVVVKGDTLWDISGKFLSKPWFWPEIWHINQQIENPHLIYPGDVLNLVYDANGCPQLALTRNTPSVVSGADGKLSPSVRELPLDEAITTIPYDVIAAFISKPTILSRDQIKSSPYVLSIREQRLVAGAGSDVYVRGPEAFTEGERYGVYNLGDALKDPDNGDTLGFQALYTGLGKITRDGDPATLRLLESARETLAGDRLVKSDNNVPLNFLPRAPAQDAEGTIMAVLDGVALIGQYQVVAINRGTSHDIEPGHVFSVWQAGERVLDRYANEYNSLTFGSEGVKLPEERAGIMMVFQSYDRMSYGLIMRATSEIKVGDKVRNPNN